MCKCVLVAVMLLWGCKGKTTATTGSGSSSAGSAGSGSGSAVAVAPLSDAAVPPTPPAPLALAYDDDDDQDAALLLAFDKKVPRLPAISADGTQIADYDSEATGPMFPPPVRIAIRRIDGKSDPEVLEIVDMEMAEKADGTNWSETPPAPPIAKVLRERGAKVIARLQGFGTLDAIDVPSDSGEPKPVKIGERTLASVEGDDESLEVSLTGPGTAPRRTRVEAYGSGDCSFRPSFNRAFMHPAKTTLYVEIQFHFRDDCGAQPPSYIAWALAAGGALGALDEVAAMATTELAPKAPFAADAQIINPRGITPAGTLPFAADPAGDADTLGAEVSRDGNAAWTSLTKKGAWRASSVMVKTGGGWRIAALDLTEPKDNAAVNRDAKAGKLGALAALGGEPGDAGLRAAFAKLATDGIAEGYEDLVAIGSGPGERTVGGATFARAWNAAWKQKVTIGSSIARLAPSGTTGWVVANIELAKKGYKIPFQVFCVFDKDTAGAWTLVHIHFAV
jgi:hypothetical protein